MTAYFIYKQNDGLTPTLYAITNKKYLKDRFMSERDMNLFIMIKKKIPDETYKIFEISHSGYLLDIRPYETKSNKDTDIFGRNIGITHILSTANEEMAVFTRLDEVFKLLSKFTREESQTFNDELLSSLHELGYFVIYKFFHVTDEFVAGIQEFNTMTDFPLKPDSLSVFLELYGWSFKKD